MAKKSYLILWKDSPNGYMWKVFDILPHKTNSAGPWFTYIRSIGKHPGLVEANAKDWIERYVEQS